MIDSHLGDRTHDMPRYNGITERLFETFGLRKRVIILGDGGLASNLARVLVTHGRNRFDVVGFLSKDRSSAGVSTFNPTVIGTIDQLFELTESHRIQTVAVCFEDRRGTMPLDALLDIKSLGVEVVDGHRMYEAECGRLSIDELKPSFLIFSQGFRRKPVVMLLKRLVDIIGALFGLFLLAPLLVVIAILIKLDSPGSVFYRQTRVGLHGYPYVLRKFRSMQQNAEDQGVKWASISDDRVTRVGYWLRRLRLDELPQFINVLKGEMSLVGPRPERPHFVEELQTLIPFYDLRHTVRPGITGWAQTCFQYAASLEDSHMKLQYDLYYVKNLSLWLDIRILLRTFHVVLLGTGAR
ncbi:MAG: TIGR03013 family XrtA/PEP-CTERM system glycosyltransferase [Nitrospirales bacterium]